LSSAQFKLLNRIEQADFWKRVQLMYIKSKKKGDFSKDLKKLLVINTHLTFNFESELEQAFTKYEHLTNMSATRQATFWYWFAGLIDGDGHLRSTNKSTEIVVTMGYEDIALLYWLKHLLGGRIVPVKDKQAFRIVFIQSNCEFQTLIQHLNGKLRHPNKIKGLTQICAKFNLKLNDVESLSKLAQDYSEHFKAYVRGLFDADGSIYIRGARHLTVLEYSSPSEYWLSQRMTAKSLRLVLGITGAKDLINSIGQELQLSLQQSLNKPKQDGNESRSYRLGVSLTNPTKFHNSNFEKLFDIIKDYGPVPTVKKVRLCLILEYLKLPRPFITQNSQIQIHPDFITYLLVWSIWPIAHKKREYEAKTTRA
jgi:hypothetical protein